MKHFVRYTLWLLLMGIAFNTLAEQNKCMMTGKGIQELEKKLTEKCAVGDALYYTTAGMYTDVSFSLAATACDFSKTIVMGKGQLACIYNGVTKTK